MLRRLDGEGEEKVHFQHHGSLDGDTSLYSVRDTYLLPTFEWNTEFVHSARPLKLLLYMYREPYILDRSIVHRRAEA